MRAFESWGRYPKIKQRVAPLRWRQRPLLAFMDERSPILAFGNGRSYGDCCLNEGGLILYTRGLDRIIEFDFEKGLLRCEAGITFDELLPIIVPRGWFFPVTPGTRFITVGGAVANDVHGKNHHRAGTFGCHVVRFELHRSDGIFICSEKDNAPLFHATIGGLGLTGLITWVEFQLSPIPGSNLNVESQRFECLDDFFALSKSSDSNFTYTVAWVDCLAQGPMLGRGIFSRANHASATAWFTEPSLKHRICIPFAPPFSLVNRVSLRAFNSFYFHSASPTLQQTITGFLPFFYPLDKIQGWNKLYGRRGFLQYQCVVGPGHTDAIREILKVLARAKQGSFLAVLKMFGTMQSPGLMSFPRPGPTLALDLPNSGAKTFRLLEQLDTIVRQAQGAVYPAKDARMSPESFSAYFPRSIEFEKFIDPAFSSSFWRRVHPPSRDLS